MIDGLKMEDIIELMTLDIDYSKAFIRIDSRPDTTQPTMTSDQASAMYLGPFPLYEA